MTHSSCRPALYSQNFVASIGEEPSLPIAETRANLERRHRLSEYNTLKRSIAAAAAGVPPPPALPVPPAAQGDAALLDAAPSPHAIQTLSVPAPSPETPDTRSAPTQGSSQLSDLIFLKPTTAASPSDASRQAVLPSTSSTGLTPRVAKVALCPLTSVADPLASMLRSPQLRKTPSLDTAAVEQVLIDLDQGESVQGVPLPDLTTLAPAAPFGPVAPRAKSVPPPLPMFLADGSAVKTSLSHPIKSVQSLTNKYLIVD